MVGVGIMAVVMEEEMEERMVEKLVEMEVEMEGGKDGRPRERHGPVRLLVRSLLEERRRRKNNGREKKRCAYIKVKLRLLQVYHWSSKEMRHTNEICVSLKWDPCLGKRESDAEMRSASRRKTRESR